MLYFITGVLIVCFLVILKLAKDAPVMDEEGRIVPQCKKCGGDMKLGDYITQTFTGSPDFVGDKHPVTLSPGGTGTLVKNGCLKCVKCGWSYAK